MINRVQSVSNNKNNYQQNFGLLKVERNPGLNLLAGSMKAVRESDAPLDEKLLEMGSNALRLANQMGTEVVVSGEKTAEDTYRLFLEMTRNGKPVKAVTLATMSKHDDAAKKALDGRVFLDTFARSIDDAYADEFMIH